MEPTAPPYYSVQHTSDPKIESLRNDQLKDGCSSNNLTSNSGNNNNKPYENCRSQLSEMNPSTYENVARFHEQQRKIASELEANNCFYGKGNPTSHNCCFQNRNNHLNTVPRMENHSICNTGKIENNSSRETTFPGKLKSTDLFVG